MQYFKECMVVTYKESEYLVLGGDDLIKILDLKTNVKLMVKPENLRLKLAVGVATKVSYSDSYYLVTEDEIIVSCTSGRVMKWDSNHPTRVQILEIVKQVKNASSNVGKSPDTLGIKRGTRIGPKNGWKPNTYYIVETATSQRNSIHKVIFYSGFLDNGFPCGYNCILSPNYEGNNTKITDTWYMKVLEELDINLKY